MPSGKNEQTEKKQNYPQLHTLNICYVPSITYVSLKYKSYWLNFHKQKTKKAYIYL